MYYYNFETPLTILFSIVGFMIVMYAQTKIQSSYQNYSKVGSKKRLTGQEVARKILDENGLQNVHVVSVKGELTDHYDPERKVVRLSTDIYHGDSIASISVAAHECGHAIQDKENYKFMRIRASLVPVVNFVTYAGYFITLISLFLGAMAYLKAGIWMLLATIVFQLVTLPVEFDASKRAKIQLQKYNLVEENEENEVSNMLESAAITYVASLISSVLNLLRLIIMYRKDDR